MAEHKDQHDARMGEVRKEIDSTDKELLELLNRRASLSLEVGKLKADSGDIIFKPFREQRVIQALLDANQGPLPHEHLQSIYREVFSSSRALQRPQKAAYLGPEGTFSYFAGVEFLGHSVEYSPQPGFEEVFHAVSSREAELGIVPLENSLQGTVGQSLDLFLRFDLHIQAEIFCRISHCLIGHTAELSRIRTVYSHPQPLAQCGRWLRANLPSAQIIPTESTAAAARRVVDDPESVAIGHKGLAAMQGLSILAKGIEDLPDNWTRFVVVAASPSLREGEVKDKTSMLFTLKDEPGSLASILNILAREDINMTKLESRPMRGERWKYVFFVDVECDLGEEQYQRVLDDLGNHCITIRVLGSYPAGPYLDVSNG